MEASDFPAFSWEDKRTDEIVVQTASDEFRYASEERYHAHWVGVRWPFDPDRELPYPEYDRDGYGIVILPSEETPDLTEPAVYDSAEGTSLSLDSLVDTVQDSHGFRQQSRDVSATADFEDNTSTSSETSRRRSSHTNMDEVPEELGPETVTERFVSTCLITNEESTLRPDEVYEAYTVFTTSHGYATEEKNWLIRRLADYIEFDRVSKHRDGKTIRVYQGIDLVQTEK